MFHDANDAKELSDDWDRLKDLCYVYYQLRPSKELLHCDEIVKGKLHQ